MPPRYAYWTIIAGGLPTAFRAVDREELLPTFHRLHEKHPDAVMKWFARGRLWNSPEDARADLQRGRPDRVRQEPSARGRPDGGRRPEPPGAKRQETTRGRDWRPGGEHRDPRQKYADAKKARNAALRKQRFDRKLRAPHQKDAPEHQTKFSPRATPRPPRETGHAGRRQFERPGFTRGPRHEEPQSADPSKAQGEAVDRRKRSKTNR